MKERVTRLCAVFFLIGCGATGHPPAGASGGSGGEDPGAAGTGGSVPGTGGKSATGGSLGASGGTGGSASTGGGTGSGGTPGASDASAPDAPAATDARVGAEGGAGDRPAGVYQGPQAAGKIEFSQDFENGMEGLGRSPPSLPESRAQVVDDPLGQRGKVLRMQWLVGDEFRSAPQFKPKAFVSSASVFHYVGGDKISHAFGYMTPSTYIGATLAQNITGGDPIWMIQGRDDGIMDVVPGLVRLPVKLEANRWYDFRVDVDYLAGAAGLVEMYIDGVKVYSHKGGLPIGSNGHLDYGIYLTGFGTMGIGTTTPRTAYFSNLSCGRR
jgi:hypothetical protein